MRLINYLWYFAFLSAPSTASDCSLSMEDLIRNETFASEMTSGKEGVRFLAINYYGKVIYIPNRFQVIPKMQKGGLGFGPLTSSQNNYFGCKLPAMLKSWIRIGLREDCMYCDVPASASENGIEVESTVPDPKGQLRIVRYKFSSSEVMTLIFDREHYIQVEDPNPKLHEFLIDQLIESDI